jgi:glycogen synthase
MHVHSPCLNGLAALPVARSSGIPLIYEMRASWEDAAVSHGTSEEGSIRYRLSRFLETQVLRRADAVITICDGLRRDVESRGIDPAKITVTPNAVDSQLLASLDDTPAGSVKQRDEMRPVIGFFGSFYAYEGLLDLVEAMPQILAAAGNVKLLLLGSGNQEAEVRNAIRRLRLEGHVELVGRVAHENVAAYYKTVDAFVFPRQKIRLTDIVTPLKPLEAMYAGALVIASDVGGHRELIQDGVTGVLFPAGDRNAMCAAIVGAVNRLKDYAVIRAEGRRFVASERTWPRVVARTAAVYESLLRR